MFLHQLKIFAKMSLKSTIDITVKTAVFIKKRFTLGLVSFKNKLIPIKLKIIRIKIGMFIFRVDKIVGPISIGLKNDLMVQVKPVKKILSRYIGKIVSRNHKSIKIIRRN